jgi:uncharacterized Zn finger protein
MQEKTGAPDPLTNITWNDLDAWVGSKTLVRGRQYMAEHRVEDLARSSSGELVAWVAGTERYATAITASGGNLRSWCTCPVGTSCKHAVAVVLEYLDALKNNVPVRTLADNDPRLLIFSRSMPGSETDLPFAKTSGQKTFSDISGHGETCDCQSAEALLRAYFDGLTKEDLVVLLEELCRESPQIGQDILARNALESSDSKDILESLRTDIDAIVQESGKQVPWNRRSADPDYSSMNDRMEVLLSMGYADAVVRCGKDLFRSSTVQIGEMDCDGEDVDDSEGIRWDVSECMKTVFLALDRSTLPVHERMMYVADLEFNDDCGLCPLAHHFWNGPFTKDDWSRFADLLLTRIEADQNAVDMKENSPPYSLKESIQKLLVAFDAANRSDDAIRFCIDAAAKPGYTPSLVRYLIRMKRWEEARQWIEREIRQEHNHYERAAELRTLQRELWEQEDDWLHIAGMRAEEFLSIPTIYGYRDLKKASERAGVWREVSKECLDYFSLDNKTGTSVSKSGGGEKILGILPRSGVTTLKPERRIKVPAYEILIAIAIDEKNPDDVITWYDRSASEKPACYLAPALVEGVADTIAEKFPERAIVIWKQIAEAYLKEARPKSYELAIGDIRKIKETLKHQDRLPEWEHYLSELKKNHVRKKRFLDMLVILDERPIVQR